MTEQERNDALDEIGREVADLFPGRYGSVTFDFRDGRYGGIRESGCTEKGALVETKRRPGK